MSGRQARFRRVVVVGLDGLEPAIAESLLEQGALPHLARLRTAGAYRRLGTTMPAQTPVAWSTFATGVNPGGHGIFDFLTRDPETYLPTVALNRHVQRSAFLPPKAENLRGGTPVWELLSEAGVASAIVRCPCTYPPDKVKGRMLSGMGVPDLRGSFGTPTFLTTSRDGSQGESEALVRLRQDGDTARGSLPGPRSPKTGAPASVDLTLAVSRAGAASLDVGGQWRAELRAGEWSAWCKVKFRVGALQAVRGMVRFLLVRTAPHLELYASPVNYDPHEPWFPISHPWEYADQLERTLGSYYTTGMVEEHTGLINGRIDEAAFLDQCAQVMDERERMLLYELERQPDGLVYCLFDTPDRLQHMFWRFREPDHPANAVHGSGDFAGAIDDLYRRCDETVGRVVDAVGDDTLLIVLSDHGFNGFRRGVNLNTWLHAKGLLTFRDGVVPGPEAGELFEHVDWSRTKAYALGLGGIYLNREGREASGTVTAGDVPAVQAQIADELTTLTDVEGGRRPIRSVARREDAYTGPYVDRAPDLLVNFERGYRASWGTALGGAPAGLVEDNTKRWSGDHVIAPELVPGVLFMGCPTSAAAPGMADLAPTILEALGVPKGPQMEGGSLLS